MDVKEYSKYRWFFTSSGKLVIGGKNSEQNEDLVTKMINSKEGYVVMHTKNPGSPFSFIIANAEKVKEKDIDETAVFTACFSHEWKKGKKEAVVDVFQSSQIYKKEKMKEGTFGVFGKVKSRKVELKLYLAMQKKKLRAVPFNEDSLIEIKMGKTPKEKAAEELAKKLNVKKEEVMQALPAGGFLL